MPIRSSGRQRFYGALFCLAMLSVAASAPSAQASSFLAFGASADSQEVIAVRFESRDGQQRATIVQREALGIEAGPVIFRPKPRLLYVASLRDQTKKGNQLVVFHVGDKGKLTRLGKFPLRHGCAYLSLDRSGKFLLSASYFQGHVNVYGLFASGLPNGSVSTVFEGLKYAHSIRTTPDNRFAYVPYVKDNNGMFQYAFDAKTGKLSRLKTAQPQVPEGIGPRHLAYHPSRPFVFFSNEQHLGASAYRIDKAGRLILLQVCDAGERKAGPGLASSDVEITPDGRFLFVGMRDFADGKLDAIDRYRVDDSGKLTYLGATKCDRIPWGLQMAPDGRHLLMTAAHGETLTLYRIVDDGSLKALTSIKWGKMVRDIAVVPQE